MVSTSLKCFVLAILAVLSILQLTTGSFAPPTELRGGISDPIYPCYGAPGSKYEDSTNCTTFYQCNESGLAAWMQCAPCQQDFIGSCCSSDRLCFNSATGDCDWCYNVNCGSRACY
ncbi:unnamed protein product [Orchesella dallaii]|uniref:Chitin-binding type-2 domain-containing protein n=1 Tax=Orchesella dallaii TaxID=48710 RepID=A0ABP1RJL3_9HEXA